ncbi:MAG TPA: FecR domain-containing protein, partial [Fimbriimonas sp.]|nr:FecR domain-containing protein [Fimbriimonas sp.]
MNHIFRHAPVAAACATLVIAGVLVGAARPGADPNKDKVRILAWSKDAKLSRKLTEKELAQLRAKRKPGDKKPLPVYKQLKGVRAGSLLEVPDILETRKAQIDIKGGTLVFQRLAPNTVLRYAKIDPTLFVPTTPAQFLMTVDKGSVQMRIGTTKQPSRIQVNGPKTITGAAGTAYSVTVTGQKTTLLVAEGQVEIASEVTPDERVLVGEREKLVFDAGSGAPFPTQAVPVTAADEPAIQALLSLPVIGLNGYSYGRDLRRADAEDIIITRVQQIKQQLDDGSYSSYKPRWGKPDRVYLTGRTDFWTTDGTGARKHAGPGLIFEAISPDGTFIIGSKPN